MIRRIGEHQPLTLGGLTLIALSAGALWAGARSQDIVLSIAGLWGVVLAALCLAAVVAFAWRIRRDFVRETSEGGTLRLEAMEGRLTETGLSLPRRGWPLVARPVWRLSDPPADVVPREDLHVFERARPHSRWCSGEIGREITIADALGIWRLRLSVRQRRELLVLPDPGRFTAAEVAVCLAAGDLAPDPRGKAAGDRLDFRPYSRSDPARLILWKVFARTRELHVRTPEPSRRPDTRPLVYLVAGEGDDAAAAMALLLLESEVLGDGARFAADGSPRPVVAGGEVRVSVALSARHRARGGDDLRTTLAGPDVAEDDPVVIVCPAIEGRWIRAVANQIVRRPERFLVIAAADAAPGAATPGAIDRLIWRGAGRRSTSGGVSGAEMLRASRPLVAAGARVVLADRRTGRLTHLTPNAAGDGLVSPEAVA